MHEVRSTFVPGEGLRRSLVAPKRSKPRETGASLTAIPINRSESRVSNHRREDRRPDIVNEAVLTFRRRKYDVAVANVSSLGAMIRAELDPRIGETVDIQFPDCNRTRCTVRWLKEGRIGLEFNEQTDIVANAKTRAYIVGSHTPAETGAKANAQRALAVRQPRHGLIWTGTLYWSFEAFSVRLRNISAEGAMLECERDIPTGSQVRLNLAEAGTMAGEVRWSRGGQLGILFDGKFDMRMLAHAKPSSSIPADAMMKPEYLKTEKDPNSPWAAMWDRFGPQDL